MLDRRLGLQGLRCSEHRAGPSIGATLRRASEAIAGSQLHLRAIPQSRFHQCGKLLIQISHAASRWSATQCHRFDVSSTAESYSGCFQADTTLPVKAHLQLAYSHPANRPTNFSLRKCERPGLLCGLDRRLQRPANLASCRVYVASVLCTLDSRNREMSVQGKS